MGIPDSLGNETFFIANPGEGITATSLVSGVPATPKPQRDYDAVEFRLDKRFARNYFLNASYTWSRLFGNYGGLASADESAFAAEGLEPVYFGNGELDIERMIAEQEGMTLEEATYQEDE